MKKHKIIITVLAMLIVLLGILVIIEINEQGAVRGYINRMFHRPAILAQYDFIDLDTCEEANEEKKNLFLAYKTKKGKVCCKETSLTIEGDPIIGYYIVDNGKLTIVLDCTFDKYGSRSFAVWDNKGIRLKYRKNDKNLYWSGEDCREDLHIAIYTIDADNAAEIFSASDLQVYQLAEQMIAKAKADNAEILDLADIGLREIPPQLCQLKDLRVLHLQGNKLRNIPREIGQLTNLQELYLQDNKITSLPIEISQLKNLHKLDLRHNALSVLPLWAVDSPMDICWKHDDSIGLNLFSNPLENSPIHVVRQGKSQIGQYCNDKLGQITSKAEFEKMGSLDDLIGKEITLIGKPTNAKVGAKLQCDGFSMYIFLPGTHWDYETGVNLLKVTGTVAVRHDLPVFIQRKGEPSISGIPVPEGADLHEASKRYVLDSVKWQIQ